MRGHADISRYPEFRAAFTTVPRGLPVIVDLREATGVDSTFLSEMLLFRRRHDAPVAVVVPAKTDIAKIFAIAGMDAKMNVYPTRVQALQALGIDINTPEEDGPFSDP